MVGEEMGATPTVFDEGTLLYSPPARSMGEGGTTNPWTHPTCAYCLSSAVLPVRRDLCPRWEEGVLDGSRSNHQGERPGNLGCVQSRKRGDSRSSLYRTRDPGTLGSMGVHTVSDGVDRPQGVVVFLIIRGEKGSRDGMGVRGCGRPNLVPTRHGRMRNDRTNLRVDTGLHRTLAVNVRTVESVGGGSSSQTYLNGI